MTALKGQNLRILTEVDSTLTCIAMATNCVITEQNNTEESSHKDIVSMASAPVTTSKSWTVQVDSLDVSDAAAMLTAIKSMTPFNLVWDETSTTDNQEPQKATFARTGKAYLSDVTFQFDDRTNSQKSLQFTGSGAITSVSDSWDYEVVSASAYTKGQFVRLFLGSDNTATPAKVIGAARQLSLHVAMQLESATTKDTSGEWQIQEPVALSYDISTNALVRSGDTISSSVQAQALNNLETIYEAGTPVLWQIANVSGANQRTKGTVIVSGSCVLQTLTINAQNRTNATYTAQLSGFGTYTVGS